MVLRALAQVPRVNGNKETPKKKKKRTLKVRTPKTIIIKSNNPTETITKGKIFL